MVETLDASFEARFDTPRGNFAAPMSRKDFDAKMAGCLEISGLDWPRGTIARLRAAVDGLDRGTSGKAVVEVMTSGR